MEPLLHYRVMAAFCRQRARMEGEDERFWLTEAEILAQLAVEADRRKLPTALQCWSSNREAS